MLVHLPRIAAVVFDPATSNAWILSSLLAFCLDVFVYHSVGVMVKACAQFAALVASGTDGSTVSRSAGKYFEQFRWLCISIYQYQG